MKIIPSPHVNSHSGTGLVHCAPAHGEEDYAAFRSLGLISNATTMLCHVDETGVFSPEIVNVVGKEAAASLVGQNVLDNKGNAAMLNLLKKERRIVKTENLTHRYPYDWKTGEPVIMTYDTSLHRYFPQISFLSFNSATSQWFANLDGIKDDALRALKPVSFYPHLCELPPPLFCNLLIIFIYEKPVIVFYHLFNHAQSGVFRGSVPGESPFLPSITFRQAKPS
jgi:isoleucyl-tRNA synthetase